ncbi:hypothetical protein COOONC_17839 [Cooperia oncophora]
MGLCIQTTTSSLVTLAPSTCDTPQFFDGNGTFYSPGYPASPQGVTPCVYVLTVAPQDLVQIHFIDIQLGDGSTIMTLTTMLRRHLLLLAITGNVPSSQYFSSSSNVMKMIYRAGNKRYLVSSSCQKLLVSGSDLASTVPSVTVTASPINPSHCNQPTTVPTNITSPGYPGNYPALTQCRYELSTVPGNRYF